MLEFDTRYRASAVGSDYDMLLGKTSIESNASLPTRPIVRDIDAALGAMLHVSQLLLGAREFRTGVLMVLEALRAEYAALRGTVSLLDPQTGQITVAVSVTAGDEDRDGDDAADNSENRPSDRIDRDVVEEDIAATVARTGKPVSVTLDRDSRVDQSALFHSRLDSEERRYICMPIVLDHQPIGALGVEIVYRTDIECERLIRFLRVVSSILAHAVKVHHAADAECLLAPEARACSDEGRAECGRPANIIGTSRPMLGVYEQIRQVAPANTTVILRGESGTGKELIAQAIHSASPRANRPFIKVSCAALPADLIESELFGHEAGAFTGATQAKKGRFELADGGTLFLDEIGEVNRATQVKLLRVLQTREFERLGGTQTIRANVRLVTATNRDLESAIRAGDFREDLYYRLDVFAINVPPLRQRRSDIPLLAHHFLETFSRTLGKRVTRIAVPAMRLLMSHGWPGNVRELGNAIERGVVVCDTRVLRSAHLPPALRAVSMSPLTNELSLRQATDAFEKKIVQEALQCAFGSRSTAARLLKTTRRILNYKVRRYNIDWQRFKN